MKNSNQINSCTCKDLTSEQLEMTISYLMSRFAVQPCEKLAHAVLHHLEILIEHVDPYLSSAKRKHYAQLFNYWWLNIYKDKNSEHLTLKIQLNNNAAVKH